MADKVKVKKSPKPGKPKIAKNLNAFTCSWTGSYDEKINFRWFLNYNSKKRNSSISKAYKESLPVKSTQKKKTLHYKKKSQSSSTYPWHDSLLRYYPFTSTRLKNVRFEVQGKKKNIYKKEKKKNVLKTKYTMSKWRGKTYPLAKPVKPTISSERTGTHSTKFTIDLNRHVTNKKYYGTHLEYQKVLRIDKNDKKGSSIPDKDWGSIERTYLYDSVTSEVLKQFERNVNDEVNAVKIDNAKSAVRWVRARVVGPPGPSGWTYANISYSDPYPTVITKATAVRNSRNGYDVTVRWKYWQSIAYPIDEMIIQYSFANLGVVRDYYEITSDDEIDSSKTYYTLTATQVPDSSVNIVDIDNYYNKVDPIYFRTEDEEVSEETTYYKFTKVKSPTILNIDNYYNYGIRPSLFSNTSSTGFDGLTDEQKNEALEALMDAVETGKISNLSDDDLNALIDKWDEKYGVYEKTRDKQIDSHKDYYTVSVVSNPVASGLKDYFEPSETPYYYRCMDDYIDTSEKYYTVVANAVSSPVESNLHLYYEKYQDVSISPDDPEWQDAQSGNGLQHPPAKPTGKLTEKDDQDTFTIYGDIPADQLLYVRVNTVYDGRTTEGKYYQVTNQKQNVVLNQPEISSVELGSDNFISITATNNSSAASVNLAVVFIPSDGSESLEVIKVITPIDTTEHSYTIEIPPQYVSSSFGIGMYAFIGLYSYTRITDEESSLGYDLYTVDATLKSKTVTYGGNIPVPPTNVEAVDLGDGNVRVSWDWNWKEADYAEVAWSDYSEALNSTDPPSNYTVPNSKTNYLIVRNLDVGKTWYFWVRLVKGANASSWSDFQSVGLTSSPATPKLSLSKRYTKLNEKFSASWTYVSTDGTPQDAAWMCLCSVSDGNIIYGEEHIVDIPGDEQPDKEAQYVTLDPRDLDWSEGFTYNLALKVRSEGGRISEEWSNYATITVVAPINSRLVDSSLLPSASDYSASSTYSVGDYVWKKDPDPANEGDADNEVAMLYKCGTAISTPESWNNSHWIVEEDDRSYQDLTSLPMTVQVRPVGSVENIGIILERAEDYSVDMPDENEHNGYEGEIVYQDSIVCGAAESESDGSYIFEIDQEDLTTYLDGLYLDDGGEYNLVIRVSDNYDQVQETRYRFSVKWDHQALMPTGSVEINSTYGAAIITVGYPEIYYLSPDLTVTSGKTYYSRTGDGDDESPYVYTEVVNPSGNPTQSGWFEKELPVEGDVCDIYRISADGYELLYSDAEFNGVYVDPYPTIGDHGGYRIVYRTIYGDFITTTNDFAWIDLDEDSSIFNSPSHIIDFGSNSVELMYNVNIDNNWSKDFQETHYLGGSIQGDWNTGVSKTTTIQTNVLTRDWDVINDMRRLAMYEGLCHIRTRDGSNFVANVDVTENLPHQMYTDPMGDDTQLCSYSLNITRLDPIDVDGLTYDDWLDTLPEE